MSGEVPKIRLRGLSKAFGEKKVLDGVDLDIRAGHGMVILGGSGSGKSVTIKCILGLIQPDAGAIEVDGRDILAMSRREREELNDRIGMLFQNGALFDSLPVWENVCFKLLAQKRITRRAARDKAAEVLAQVGLAASVGDLSPAELSGGMQQRASIARALAFDADILLMDEPFGALDEIVRDRLNEEVLKLWARTGKTIGFVTHSIPEAVYLSTRIVVMSPRPGRITDVIESPLPRERPLDIRDSAEFIAIAHRVRDGLRAGHSYDD